MKSAVDGHVTSSKFTIATRNQGTMNDHFVIDSEGKVGIGTTSSPNKKIEHDDELTVVSTYYPIFLELHPPQV